MNQEIQNISDLQAASASLIKEKELEVAELSQKMSSQVEEKESLSAKLQETEARLFNEIEENKTKIDQFALQQGATEELM